MCTFGPTMSAFGGKADMAALNSDVVHRLQRRSCGQPLSRFTVHASQMGHWRSPPHLAISAVGHLNITHYQKRSHTFGRDAMPERSDQALSKRLRQDLIERLTEKKDDIFWTGAAFAVVGILALLFPFFTTMTVAFMIGWVLIFAGAVTIYGAFSVEGTGPFFGQMLLGLLTLALGVYLMMHPAVSIVALTIMLAVIFMFDGAAQLVLAFDVRPRDGWIWVLLSGLVSIGVGLLIAAELPGSSRVALGILVGIKFLATGIAYIVFSRALPSPSAS